MRILVVEPTKDPYETWNQIRDELNECYGSRTPREHLPLSQQKEFKPVRNMVIREVVQMMEQLQPQNVERNDEWSRTVPEPKVVAESSVPFPTHRVPPPESVSACMIRMLHHMGNIFRDNTPQDSTTGVPRIDRKRLRELTTLKIALGHRPDDHEEEQTMGGMTMGGW